MGYPDSRGAPNSEIALWVANPWAAVRPAGGWPGVGRPKDIEWLGLESSSNTRLNPMDRHKTLPSDHGRMGRGGHGLFKVSTGPGLPYLSTPCGWATPETVMRKEGRKEGMNFRHHSPGVKKDAERVNG
jgi:hypothetical protein